MKLKLKEILAAKRMKQVTLAERAGIEQAERLIHDADIDRQLHQEAARRCRLDGDAGRCAVPVQPAAGGLEHLRPGYQQRRKVGHIHLALGGLAIKTDRDFCPAHASSSLLPQLNHTAPALQCRHRHDGCVSWRFAA